MYWYKDKSGRLRLVQCLFCDLCESLSRRIARTGAIVALCAIAIPIVVWGRLNQDSLRQARMVEAHILDSLRVQEFYSRATGDTLITLRRTECYGSCPVYIVAIDGSGHITYYGKMFVSKEGVYSDSTAPDSVAALIEEFRRVGFYAFKDEYLDGPTDLPTKIVTIKIGSESKTVVDYYGAPAELKILEQRIDSICRTNQWTGVEERRRRSDSLRVLREQKK